MISTHRTYTLRLALPLCALVLGFTSLGCEPKEKKAPAPTAETTPAEAPTPAEVPPEAPPQLEAASEAERALAKDFIVRFTKILELSKSDGWLEMQSMAQRVNLVSKDAVEKSYGAWVAGTVPVMEAIRANEFRLEKLPTGQLLLTFDGITVPNHPDAPYEIRMVVEEGELRMDQN